MQGAFGRPHRFCGMDALDAFLQLQHAAGNAAWLRQAIDTAGGPLALAGHLMGGTATDWQAAGAPAALRAAALGAGARQAAALARAWQAGGPERHLIPWGDAAYPGLLREAPSPPSLLYVEGRAERLWWPQIAVVGSRAPSPAGRERAQRWARAFAEAGFVVTSGLARGIDAAAHGACLEAPGSIAVIGTGPDLAYPEAHRALQAALVREGCVASEHPPGTPARAAHFPSRNRIIAGLSLATVVVEAALRSGSLITARLAAEASREVFALPGSPEQPKARGCHWLIREGATLADDPAQVVEALAGAACQLAPALAARLEAGDGRSPPPAALPAAQAPAGSALVSAAAGRVLAALDGAGASLEVLAARAGLTPAALAPILLDMELEGRLTQQHGVYLPCGSAPPTRAGSQRRR